MKEDHRPQEICAIWIDHTNRIISFRKEDGFEPRAFLSPDEQMQYALEKCSNGCRGPMTGCEFRMRKYAHFCNVPSPLLMNRSRQDDFIRNHPVFISGRQS